MKHFMSPDGNVLGLGDGRSLDSRKVPYPGMEPFAMRALQMHSSLVQRLNLETVMEGHQGCVNALAWNSKGSLLLSGSDDTKVNLWDYGRRKLLHSIDTGHSANIFCTKFMPETGDDVVVSGSGDAEVRVHRVSRSVALGSRGASFSEQTALFRCHTRRVKKLAVEDGNPHMIWSASEDGTLRQHDLREGILCPAQGAADQECQNILLDLRSGAKRSLSDPSRHCLALKTCAVSPTRPHLLLIGGSDAFARLYDRRMLPPPTSSRQPAKTPPCVCYFCPAHLSDYSRSGLHLTHVTFSPNGQEVLLSYSGEHIYLMNANSGEDDAIVYMDGDVSKRMFLTPIINGTRDNVPHPSVGTLGRGRRRNSAWLQECKDLFEEAKKALEERKDYLYAIEASSEVVDAGGPVVGAGLRHDCLSVRAAALLKRGWKNDVHMAIRDCNEARAINPMSICAHNNMAEALSQLGRYKEALEYAIQGHHLEPSDSRLLEHVTELRTKIKTEEEARTNRASEGEINLERRPPRIRSISDLLFRSEPMHGDISVDPQPTEGEEPDYFDDGVQLEMEIEMSVAEVEERDRDRVQRQGESARRERSLRSHSAAASSTTGASNENARFPVEVAVDMQQRYVGHCNTGTDIKQASFLGERGEFVASGSDDGHWFIWHKRTGRLVKILNGDENVVNCVQCHPFDCAIATSGIDNTIKLWTPCGGRASTVEGGAGSETAEFLRVMADNQRQMRRHQEIGLPMELLQRFRVQEGTEGAVHPFQCTQS